MRTRAAESGEVLAYRENPWDFYLTAHFSPHVHHTLSHLKATGRNLLVEQSRYRRNFGRLFFGNSLSVEEVRDTTMSIGDGRLLKCEAVEMVNTRGIGGIAYFGWTHPDRLDSPTLVAEQDEQLRQLLITPRNRIKPYDPAEFVLEMSSPHSRFWSAEEVEDVRRIYSESFIAYPRQFTTEFVREELLTDCWVFLARSRSTGHICAVTLVDVAYGFGDITEVATDPVYHNRGLATAVVSLATETMRSLGIVCHAEVRADSYSMMRVMHTQGFEYCGTLPGHILFDSKFRSTTAERTHHFASLRVFSSPL